MSLIHLVIHAPWTYRALLLFLGLFLIAFLVGVFWQEERKRWR